MSFLWGTSKIFLTSYLQAQIANIVENKNKQHRELSASLIKNFDQKLSLNFKIRNNN